MGLLNIIRRMHLLQKLWLREIVRLTGVSRTTVAKHLAANTIEPIPATPERQSKLDPFAEKLPSWLKIEAGKARKERRSVKQLRANLLVLGFIGSYARVPTIAWNRCPSSVECAHYNVKLPEWRLNPALIRYHAVGCGFGY
jgi:hypothetical protein